MFILLFSFIKKKRKGNLDGKRKALNERFNFLESLFLEFLKGNNE